MNILYFHPGANHDGSKKNDKSLISPNQLKENSQKKAQKIESSKNKDLISNDIGRLLTSDGREIFNENK